MTSPDYTELVTQAEYARRRGCARQTVLDRVKAGQISAFGPKKLICPALADNQWAANVRARASNGATRPDQPSAEPLTTLVAAGASGALAGEGGKAPSDDYQSARARREAAEAERAELEVAKMAGRLIDREDGERAVFAAFRALRDSVMRVPLHCAPEVLGMTEVRDIERRFTDELRKAFTMFSDPVSGKFGREIE